jgi:hypothetical protein
MDNCTSFDPTDPRLPERIRSKFEVLDVPRHHLAEGPCWIWTAGKNDSGYGTARHVDFKTNRAHIIVYTLLSGAYNADLQIDHLCRNRSCVNPAHLEPVTQKENLARGFGIGSINSRKAYCSKGHALEADNVTILPRGERRCKKCHVERNVRSRSNQRKARRLSEREN